MLQKSVQVVAFIVAVIGAVPQYGDWIETWDRNLPWGQLNQAKQQHHLWEVNQGCFKDAKIVPVKTVTNDEVGVAVCPKTGDLLLNIQPAGARDQIVWWIPTKSVEKQSFLQLLHANAFAQENFQRPQLAALATTIVCQRTLPNQLLLRRVKFSANGRCFDQQINTYSGIVVSTVRARSCDSTCR